MKKLVMPDSSLVNNELFMEAEIKEIQERLSELSLRDRFRLSKRLRNLRRKLDSETPMGWSQELEKIKKYVEKAYGQQKARIENRPVPTYPEALPIISKKAEILESIKHNQVIIVSGETGSGKSTQLPKMCLEAGRGLEGKIVCTQPRRIAAITIAHRIAEELGGKLGDAVGYKIRFGDKTSPRGYIKIVTDGMLLSEIQSDCYLLEYDTIIIDEAHERSVNIDFLLGILKNLLAKRPELKLIISSATLETEKFSSFFDNAPIINVGGRMYPVDIEYMPVEPELEEKGEVTYVDMALKAVDSLVSKGKTGDILVFMPTEQDIIETCDRLEGRKYEDIKILPLFARLPAHKQREVYLVKQRKIVVATNVAETSLTIPGIKYVIDTGLARISRYVARTRTTSLPISPISKASADQRKGRCGRLQNGICIRLYSEQDYEQRPTFTVPEILRSNLAEVILRMIYLRLGQIASFPFLDRPSPRSIKDGFDLLEELGAIKRKGQKIFLTEYGKIMARMPLDPRISRMMIEALKEDCVREVAIIASALSIQDPRERPPDMAEEADKVHAPFKDPESDFITLINIWNQYHRALEDLKSQNKMRKFCRENFLSFPRMREWAYIYDQIFQILREQKINVHKNKEKEKQPLYERIHKAILSGLLSNIAVKKDRNTYQGTKGREIMIFPGSVLFKKSPTWIVAAEMVKTSRLYARTVGKIKPEWIELLAGDRCKSSYFAPYWDRQREEVRAFEKVSLYGLVVIPKRNVSYRPINPKEAHEIFIQSALVEGDVEKKPDFLLHNQRLIKELKNIENKIRRTGILVGDDRIFDFYSQRLPGVCDMRELRKIIKERGDDSFLRMRKTDVLLSYPEIDISTEYPDQISINGVKYEFSYKFTPGHEDDGITISVPVNMASGLCPQRLEWLVPGLLKDKILAIMKGLPKRYRKLLIPISRTAEICASGIVETGGSLATALSKFVSERFGVNIPASVWQGVEIPEHLRMRISIVDHEGKELLSSRDISEISKYAGTQYLPAVENTTVWGQAKGRWERDGIKQWPMEEIPRSIEIKEGLVAYPGFDISEKGVSLRLFTTEEQARKSHVKGVESLCRLTLSKELKFLKRGIKLPSDLEVFAIYFGGMGNLENGIYDFLVRENFRKDIRTKKQFYEHVESIKGKLHSEANRLIQLVCHIVRTFGQVRGAIFSLEKAKHSNSDLMELCTMLRKEMDWLVPQNFLEIYSNNRLIHLPRYLRAKEVRIQRAAYDTARDRKKARQLESPLNALDRIKNELSPYSSEEKRAAIESFQWMIEEFKVSIFAQELGTALPVSLKRLEQKVEEIDRMV